MTTLSTHTDHQDSGLWAALGTTALTLLVVGAAAVWLMRPQRGMSIAGDVGQETVSGRNARATPGGLRTELAPDMATIDTTAPPDVPALVVGNARALVEPRPPATRGVTPTMVIVESQERAHELRAAIDQMSVLGATQGEPPLAKEVRWFDSPDAEAKFWATFIAQQMTSGGSLPGSVIDLRDPAEANVCSIVHSQVDVEVLQAFAVVVNRTRVAAGLPPLIAENLVAPSATSAAPSGAGGACGPTIERADC